MAYFEMRTILIMSSFEVLIRDQRGREKTNFFFNLVASKRDFI